MKLAKLALELYLHIMGMELVMELDLQIMGIRSKEYGDGTVSN